MWQKMQQTEFSVSKEEEIFIDVVAVVYCVAAGMLARLEDHRAKEAGIKKKKHRKWSQSSPMCLCCHMTGKAFTLST